MPKNRVARLAASSELETVDSQVFGENVQPEIGLGGGPQRAMLASNGVASAYEASPVDAQLTRGAEPPGPGFPILTSWDEQQKTPALLEAPPA